MLPSGSTSSLRGETAKELWARAALPTPAPGTVLPVRPPGLALPVSASGDPGPPPPGQPNSPLSPHSPDTDGRPRTPPRPVSSCLPFLVVPGVALAGPERVPTPCPGPGTQQALQTRHRSPGQGGRKGLRGFGQRTGSEPQPPPLWNRIRRGAPPKFRGGASCLGTCPGLQAPHPATHTCTCQVSWDPGRWWLQPLTARSISGRAPKAGPPQDTFQDLTLLPEVCPGDPDGSGHQRPPPPGRDTHPTTAWAQPGSRGGVCASAGAVSREQSQPHPSPTPPPSQGGPPGPLKAKQGPLGVSPRLRAGDKEAAASRVGWGPRPL